VLPLPVDYLTWSHDIGDFFDQSEFAVRNKTVLIAGEASMTAQRRLTERGWNLVLRAPHEGASEYALDRNVRLAIVTHPATSAAGRHGICVGGPNQLPVTAQAVSGTLTSIRAIYNRTPEVSHVERSVIHAAPSAGRFGCPVFAAVRLRLRR
jgi:hypothetical protein